MNRDQNLINIKEEFMLNILKVYDVEVTIGIRRLEEVCCAIDEGHCKKGGGNIGQVEDVWC